MSYELWDTASGNCLATFRSEATAARHVRSIMEQFGRAGLEGLSVGHYDLVRRRTRRIGTGAGLDRWSRSVIVRSSQPRSKRVARPRERV
jgi:hypothetical protein